MGYRVKSNKSLIKTAALWALLFLFSYNSNAQLDSAMNHQVGVNANRIFNGLFKNQLYNAALVYNFKLKNNFFARTGADYMRRTGEDGEVNVFGKLGVQNKLVHYKRLRVYYGVDLFYAYFESYSSKDISHQAGFAPFLGTALIFHKNFSIAMEPKFYTIRAWSWDEDSFDQTVYTSWLSGLTNIGQVQLRFMF